MNRLLHITALTVFFFSLASASCAEMVVHTTDGRSISVPVERHQIRSIDFFSEASGYLPDPGRVRSHRVFSAVPAQNTNAFRHNPERSLSIDTAKWDRTPFFITEPADWEITLAPGQQCFLSGSPDGRANWSVDNFLLFEVFTGRETRRFVMGEVEPVFFRGQRLEQIGHNAVTFTPAAVDLCSYLPRGVDFRLRISAFDYGGTGHVSQLFLIMQ